jgi:hypothetical protein
LSALGEPPVLVSTVSSEVQDIRTLMAITRAPYVRTTNAPYGLELRR